jgi:hypothetical protein
LIVFRQPDIALQQSGVEIVEIPGKDAFECQRVIIFFLGPSSKKDQEGKKSGFRR